MIGNPIATSDTLIAPAKPFRQQVLAPRRGAAIAGVIFSVLMIAGLGLSRLAVPTDLTHPGTWLSEPDRRDAVRLSLDLVPFAGIAFLWFMGVLRNRLGALEDQFFATVLLASGLLFVACMFVAAAVMGALIESVAAGNVDSETYYFGRRITDALINLFAMKMAGVFMISACTIRVKEPIPLGAVDLRSSRLKPFGADLNCHDGIRDEIMKPGWVPRRAAIRSDYHDVIAVAGVAQWAHQRSARFGAGHRQQQDGHRANERAARHRLRTGCFHNVRRLRFCSARCSF
jgi:hypothetical protein